MKERSTVLPPLWPGVPRPGTEEAHKAGCSCPTFDNNHGHGCGSYENGAIRFYWLPSCTVHGEVMDAYYRGEKR